MRKVWDEWSPGHPSSTAHPGLGDKGGRWGMSEHLVSLLTPHTHTLEKSEEGGGTSEHLVSLVIPPSHGLVEV